MRGFLVPGGFGTLVALILSGCVTAPPADAPMRPRVSVLDADGRALRYGTQAPEIISNLALRDQLVALYGADWDVTAPGRSRLTIPAAHCFGSSAAPRLVEIDGQPYIALMGCAVTACSRYRGLLLIREDGGQLLSRLDDGGFAHYYAYGLGLDRAGPPQAAIDGAWRLLDRVAGGRPAGAS